MLYEFLENHREAVLALAEESVIVRAGALASSDELRRGLPVFYEHLIHFLKTPDLVNPEETIHAGATIHGKELLRLKYTLSQVVHSYGSLCQAITGHASREEVAISSQEFKYLNLCLDIGIASAVSEFQFRTVQASEAKEILHLGGLVHELRNALSSATIAHEMIKQGLVGTGGSTASVLEENLMRMRHLIDRSFSEVRLRAAPELIIEVFPLNVLIDQILLTAQSEARTKNQTLKNESVSAVDLETDRQLLLSTIANIVQNALKYTKTGGHIFVRATDAMESVTIEIRDECGGLSPSALQNVFRPFMSGGFDQSGLGLGLTIVHRAVLLMKGTISVENHSGIGCSFVLTIPKRLTK